MLLEAAAGGYASAMELPLASASDGLLRTDWEPLLSMLCNHRRSVAERAWCFHATLAEALHAQALAIRKAHGVTHVGLSGGVFQNRLLTAQAISLLQASGFTVHLPSEIPVNDAGICYGQVLESGLSGQSA